ncbi:MAG: glycosyltransferase family 4 protein, partial [Pseudomonadota bacterium]|nr:glycosyltransferase family 4 protein [Pseudomonadota bacterium]
HWIVFGDGHRRPWLEQQRVQLGLQRCFHVLGQRPMETMPYYFALADVLLVTLRNDPIFALTIPSKVQSYLACAKPIVAALDGEGARVVTDSGAGIAVPAGNASALAEAVLRLYRQPPEQRRRMGECGRTYFDKNFEREMLIDRLESWMLEVTEGNACAS